MIYSGDLREKISFYKVVEETSQSGYKTTDERLICTVRAYRLKNKESYGVDGDALFHSTELTFLIRMRHDIDETNIVVYNGERYRITSFSPYIAENEIRIIIAKIND